METSFLDNIEGGFVQLIHLVNWVFVALFIVFMFILNEGTDSDHPLTKWLNWLQNIPKKYRALAFGIILAIIWAWLDNKHTKADIQSLFISVVISMVLWQLGLSKIFDAAKSRWNKIWDKIAGNSNQ